MEDLLIMKVLASRRRDVQDARGIVVVQAQSLDWDYCLHLAADLAEAVDQNLVAILNGLRRDAEEESG